MRARRRAVLFVAAAVVVGAPLLYRASRPVPTKPPSAEAHPVLPDRAPGLASRGEGRPPSLPAADATQAAVAPAADVGAEYDLRYPGWRVTLVDGRSGQPLLRSQIERSGGVFQDKGFGMWLSPDSEHWRGLSTEDGIDLRVSAHATRTRWVWPMWPARAGEFVVLDAGGAPVEGAIVERKGFGGSSLEATALSDLDGRARISALLAQDGDQIRLEVGFRGFDWRTWTFLLEVPAGGETVTGVLRLTDEARTVVASEREVQDAPRAEGEAISAATLNVFVRGPTGRPLVGVRVAIQSDALWGEEHGPRYAAFRAQATDAEGSIRHTVVGGMVNRVALVDLRHVPVTTWVTVDPGETATVVLVEPEAATLDVVVEDREGAPVPCAWIDVRTPSGVPPWDVVDGTCRIDPFANGDGRRRYTIVEPGALVVTARHGTREGTTAVTLTPGGAGSVVVRLP